MSKEKATPEVNYYSQITESMIEANKKKKTKLLDSEEASKLYQLEEQAKELKEAKKKEKIRKKIFHIIILFFIYFF